MVELTVMPDAEVRHTGSVHKAGEQAGEGHVKVGRALVPVGGLTTESSARRSLP